MPGCTHSFARIWHIGLFCECARSGGRHDRFGVNPARLSVRPLLTLDGSA